MKILWELKDEIWAKSPTSLKRLYRWLNPNPPTISRPVDPLDEVIQTLLEKFDTEDELVVIDVGANVGQSIMRFSRYLEGAIFHTFEPIESCHLLLEDRFQGANFVHNHIALSNENGVRKFFEFRKADTSSFLRPDLTSDWASRRAARYAGGNLNDLVAGEYEVKTRTLDSYISSSRKLAESRVHLLKMDTQGHEGEVLEGSTKLLSDSARRPLLVESEVTLGFMYEKHSNFFDIERHLIPRGYRLVAFGGGNLLEKPSLGINALYASPEVMSAIPH